MVAQTERDALALDALMQTSKNVEDCLSVYEKAPDDLWNLKKLSDGFFEYVSHSFNFLMMTQCKPPQEYQEKADKYQRLLQPVVDRLTKNKNKLEQTIDNAWAIFSNNPGDERNAEMLIEKLRDYLAMFGQQRDSKHYNKINTKVQKILKKRK